MRILLVGPEHSEGSIPPYVTVLADALRNLGAVVDRLGSKSRPFDLASGRFGRQPPLSTQPER